MSDDTEQDRQRFILETSRAIDAFREWNASQELDWCPLHDAVPIEHRDGFVWMFRVAWQREVIEVYKHGITRRSLHLDHRRRAYLYIGDAYMEIPVDKAVDRVFEDIEKMGCTRETPYTGEYRREKYRRAREAGWTVIS